jgi:hypothetical protein
MGVIFFGSTMTDYLLRSYVFPLGPLMSRYTMLQIFQRPVYSASSVVRMGRSVNGHRPKWTPYGSKTPQLMKTKLNTLYNVRGYSSRTKTHHQAIKGAGPTKGQHTNFVSFFSFFILFVSCQCWVLILTIETSNDA